MARVALEEVLPAYVTIVRETMYAIEKMFNEELAEKRVSAHKLPDRLWMWLLIVYWVVFCSYCITASMHAHFMHHTPLGSAWVSIILFPVNFCVWFNLHKRLHFKFFAPKFEKIFAPLLKLDKRMSQQDVLDVVCNALARKHFTDSFTKMRKMLAILNAGSAWHA